MLFSYRQAAIQTRKEAPHRVIKIDATKVTVAEKLEIYLLIFFYHVIICHILYFTIFLQGNCTYMVKKLSFNSNMYKQAMKNSDLANGKSNIFHCECDM